MLDTDKFGFELRFALFKKHPDDFSQVTVKLVERFGLRVGSGKPRHMTPIHFNIQALLILEKDKVRILRVAPWALSVDGPVRILTAPAYQHAGGVIDVAIEACDRSLPTAC